MFAVRIGALLRKARTRRGLSRAELAREGGVSLRLVSELEQGKRPNVSLETALTLLRAAGITVVAQALDGDRVEIRDPSATAMERAARAAERRLTWTGRQVPRHAADDPPRPPRSKGARLVAAGAASRQAAALAPPRGPKATRVSRGR